ncbi:MAG: hypothetical protein OXH83_11460 [Bryobacterales bacterium]|nr:hypothetical protein [Bryobacterales bacterium]
MRQAADGSLGRVCHGPIQLPHLGREAATRAEANRALHESNRQRHRAERERDEANRRLRELQTGLRLADSQHERVRGHAHAYPAAWRASGRKAWS